MKASTRKIVLFVSFPILGFLAWFGWMTYMKSESEWVQERVNQAMSQSLESLAPQWPRIETHTSAGAYFSPEINQSQVFEFTSQTLELLNQDPSLPPLKLLNVSLEKGFGDSEDTLIGRALVKFPLIAGINIEVIVQDGIKIPHYATIH
jgi:hypothetical protein